MNNFKVLVFQEIYQQFKSFKFFVLIVLAFTVSLSVSYVRLNNFKEGYDTYLSEVKRSQEKLKKVQVYSELEIAVFYPPNPLSIFANGVDDKVGNKIIVSATHYPGIQSTSQKANPFLNLFSDIDIIGIVKLFSIFVILMTAGIIAGEREDKTLKMVFINNVSRIEYFLAKYMAVSVVVFCSVILIFLTPTLIILMDNQISIGSNFIGGVASLLVVSFFYISVFILFSLLVSVRTGSSAQAVLITLFIWLGMTFIYPQITSSLISQIKKASSKVVLEAEIKKIDLDLVHDNGDFFVENYPKQKVDMYINEGFDLDNGKSSLAFVSKKIGLTQKYYFEFEENFINKSILGIWKRHNIVQSLENAYKKSLLSQATLFEFLNFITPDVVYKQISEKLAGTDRKYREEDFQDAASSYRELLIDYVRSKNGFGYLFFTQTREEDMKDNYNTYTQEDKKKYTKFANLETDDIPQFTLQHKKTFPNEILILVGVNLLLFTIGSIFFYRLKIL